MDVKHILKILLISKLFDSEPDFKYYEEYSFWRRWVREICSQLKIDIDFYPHYENKLKIGWLNFIKGCIKGDKKSEKMLKLIDKVDLLVVI